MMPLDRDLLDFHYPGEVPGRAEAEAKEVLEDEIACDEPGRPGDPARVLLQALARQCRR